jgi:hypothetical protein
VALLAHRAGVIPERRISRSSPDAGGFEVRTL